MPASSLTSSSSAEPEDSDDDLDDVPLSFARDSASRYADDPPPTSRGTPLGFAARGLPPAFKLNLGTPPGGAAASSRGGAASPFADGLEEMRSEPVSLPSSRAGGPPKLSLNLAGVRATSLSGKDVAAAAEDDGFAVPPPTQRGTPFKPPRLNLSNPASASPVASGGMQMLPPRQDGAPSAMPAAAQQQHAATPSIASSHAASRSGPVHVELISAAFVLQDAQRHASQQLEPEPAGPSDRIRARCSQQLGVAADQIELYELRPLPANGGQLPDGCSNVGVRIQGASEDRCGPGASRREGRDREGAGAHTYMPVHACPMPPAHCLRVGQPPCTALSRCSCSRCV